MKSFSSRHLLDAVRRVHNIETLNDIQRDMASRKGSQVILLSPTGSGKTLAFALPLLQSLNIDNKRTPAIQALVLAPSRELVIQIYNVIRPLALPLKTVALYGGHKMSDETASVKGAVPDIVISTPGRLTDHLSRNTLSIDDVHTLVLDEYDKALELGFADQMRRIVRRLKHLSTTILTSATRLDDIPDWVDMRGATTLDYLPKKAIAHDIDYRLVHSDKTDKLDTLQHLLSDISRNGRTIVFVNHRESAQRVYDHLKTLHLPVGLYHGALDQQQREMAVDLLNNNTTPILVSTDLGARGLDITNVANVVHYHIPVDETAYTHRNGRTARAGASGNVFVIANDHDKIPPYMAHLKPYHIAPNDKPIRPEMQSLYFPAGKKERLSAGDIVGFITKNTPLTGADIGKIVVRDHYAIAAIPAKSAHKILADLHGLKIKNKSLKISLL